jgi:hypothetical protein
MNSILRPFREGIVINPVLTLPCRVMVDLLVGEVVVAAEVISLVFVGTTPRTTITTNLNVSCVA